MIRDLLNYFVCSVALFFAIVLTCSGGLATLFGVAAFGALYATGKAFPTVWKRFWITNLRILNYFGCL